MLGFPIRTSADRGLVDGSPQLFAVTHVLHRFLVPRHPPLALCSLEEQRCSCLLCSSQRASPAPGSCSVEDGTLTEHAVAAELEGSCRALRVGPGSGSLKTEEKTKFMVQLREEDGSYDTRRRTTSPNSAPTGNWFEPDRTNAGQRLNSSSLERR